MVLYILVNLDMKMKSPLFRGPLVNSSTENPMKVLTQNQLKHQTSLTYSIDKVIPNILHSYMKNRNFDFTSPYGSTSNTEFIRTLRNKFQDSLFSSSGLDCLKNAGDFVINKNVLHRGYHSVQQIFSNVLSSPLSSDTSLFLSILIGVTFFEEFCPEHILNIPTILFSDMFPIVKEYLRDVYVNHVCITHKTVSPCECGEPINHIVKEFYPQTSFDPLEEHNHTPNKLKNRTCMLGTLLLVIVLIMDKAGSCQLVQM